MLGAIEENKIGVHDSKYLRSSGGWGVEEQRQKRESQAYSTLSAEPNAGLNLTTLRSQPELKPRVGCST